MSLTALLVFCLISCIFSNPIIRIDSDGDDSSTITFSVTNPTLSDISFLKWGTPFEGVRSDMFDVFNSKNSSDSPYIGIVIKRGPPSPTDYMKVPKDSTISVTVDIARFYNIEQKGEYKITLDLPSYVDDFKFENNETFIDVEKEDVTKLKSARKNNNNLMDSKKAGCTARETDDIARALTESKPVVRAAYKCMKDRSCDILTNAWFGGYNKKYFDYVRDNVLLAIDNHMNKYQFKSVCHSSECDDNTYAYVFPSDKTFTVYLCNLFFKIPNERVETIIHEMSHFASLGATDDYMYGRENCKLLAKSNPYEATHNADNICYFASDVSKRFRDNLN